MSAKKFEICDTLGKQLIFYWESYRRCHIQLEDLYTDKIDVGFFKSVKQVN